MASTFSGVRCSIDLLGRQMLIVMAVHRHHGCTDTGRKTLLLHLESDAPVRRRLPESDTELALHVPDDLLTSAEHA